MPVLTGAAGSTYTIQYKAPYAGKKKSPLSRIIEQGIAIHASKGSAQAWTFLIFHAVPRHIVARVLAEAGRCRSSDRAGASGCVASLAEAGVSASLMPAPDATDDRVAAASMAPAALKL